jgi:adenine-specific DNA-methyltransferase
VGPEKEELFLSRVDNRRGMGIRFIGHKKRLLPGILDVIDNTVDDDVTHIADLFAGTGAVSAGLKSKGYHVIANDILTHCCVLTRAQLLNSQPPSFDKLLDSYPEITEVTNTFVVQTDYSHVLSYLNSLDGTEGFFYKHYAPGGTQSRDEPRQYFTDENAQRIDAIRATIKQWNNDGLLSEAEHSLLLYDLIRATNEIANTAGTYGAYLKEWYERAREPIKLTPAEIPSGPTDHEIHQRDANELAEEISPDAVYLDPPYTKRQYASYYHIPETIAEEDEPDLSGKTGLRPWEEKSSDYCHKKRAPDQLHDLLSRLNTRYIFLSYSTEGHISPDTIEDILSEIGSFELHEFDHPRYKSNDGAKGGDLTECLYAIQPK